MNILAFANDYIAIPSLENLIQQNLLRGIVIPKRTGEDIERIKTLGANHNITVFEVSSSDLTPSLKRIYTKIQPTASLIFTFPYKIPSYILNKFFHPFLNFHFGLLPQFRGPQPIFWEIRNGETQGGITVHVIKNELDEGNILWTELVPIDQNETFGLHKVKLAFAAVGVLPKIIFMLKSGKTEGVPQKEELAKYYRRPQLEDLIVDWQKMNNKQVLALIKACNPWNTGAISQVRGISLRIIEGQLVDEKIKGDPGSVVKSDQLRIICADDTVIQLDILSLEEGIMLGSQLLKLGISKGDCFESPLIKQTVEA